MSSYNRESFIEEAKKATHRYDIMFMDACHDFDDLPWRLMKAQGFVESRLNPEATSVVGARGIMQLMRPTFRDMIRRLNVDETDITDPWINIRAGVKYFLWCRDRFKAPGLSVSVQNDLAFASYLIGWKRVKNSIEYPWVTIRYRSDLVAALNRVSLGSETLNYIENIDIAHAVFLSSR